MFIFVYFLPSCRRSVGKSAVSLPGASPCPLVSARPLAPCRLGALIWRESRTGSELATLATSSTTQREHSAWCVARAALYVFVDSRTGFLSQREKRAGAFMCAVRNNNAPSRSWTSPLVCVCPSATEASDVQWVNQVHLPWAVYILAAARLQPGQSCSWFGLSVSFQQVVILKQNSSVLSSRCSLVLHTIYTQYKLSLSIWALIQSVISEHLANPMPVYNEHAFISGIKHNLSLTTRNLTSVTTCFLIMKYKITTHYSVNSCNSQARHSSQCDTCLCKSCRQWEKAVDGNIYTVGVRQQLTHQLCPWSSPEGAL